jgi:hypothetical protein
MNAALPGEDLIDAGLKDLHAGRETIPALLVAIGSPRLRRLGLALPEQLPADPEPSPLQLARPGRPGFSAFPLQRLYLKIS